MEDIKNLLTIKQASDWASKLLKKNVTPSNISYLIQYGRIRKIGSNGDTLVAEQDLSEYYDSYLGKREAAWKGQTDSPREDQPASGPRDFPRN